jgi:cystathionine beta-lyase/cystathionine gamma-synthase
MKTLEMRMLKKCINTLILARWLAAHPQIQVHGPANSADANAENCARLSYLGLPSPLFTIDFEAAGLERMSFERFFDSLAPMFGHMVSLGQSNTVVLCPALTSHSEMGPEALRAAGITPTTIRIAVGDEDPRELIRDFLATARLALEPAPRGFCVQSPAGALVAELVDTTYLDVHRRHAAAARRFNEEDPVISD